MTIVDIEVMVVWQPDLDPTVGDGSHDALIVRVATGASVVPLR